MSTATLSKITAKTATEVCKRFALEDEAKKLLKDGVAPKPFLDQLMTKNLFPDAIRFLAFALPKREAVWWACQVARAAGGPTLPPPQAAAVQAAEKWVSTTAEDARRAALPIGQLADVGTPAGLAALGAFWSGGSLAPAELPAVPPADHLTAQAVAGAVILAGVLKEPEKAAEKYRKFLALGQEVAGGVNKWK